MFHTFFFGDLLALTLKNNAAVDGMIVHIYISAHHGMSGVRQFGYVTFGSFVLLLQRFQPRLSLPLQFNECCLDFFDCTLDKFRNLSEVSAEELRIGGST